MKCVVLAGAGASYAVNPKQFPTTAQFVERLPEDIKSSGLYKLILQIISEQADEPADIEKVLWRLLELNTHLKPLTNQQSTVARAFQQNRLARLITGDTDAVFQAAPVFVRHIELLVEEINKVVYDLYAHMTPQNELEGNWIPLLSDLSTRCQKLYLFTTNYDRVLENAANFVNGNKIPPKIPLHSGYINGVERELDVTLWSENTLGQSLSGTTSNGLITKLHGSVDWSSENQRVVIGGAFYKGNHARHAILYPGLTGLPDSEPFRSFHSFFDLTLAAAEYLIVIGFAFRDDAINTSIVKASKESGFKGVVVIDPTKTISTPPGIPANKIFHIDSGFDSSSVVLALQRLT